MRSWTYLLIFKQIWRLVAVVLSVVLFGTIFMLGNNYYNKVVKIPVAIQDLDKSKTSSKIIQTLKNNTALKIINTDIDEAFIETSVKKKESVISLSIPKGFEKQLKKRNINRAITLYYKDDFISTIGKEVISKTIFETQIPRIIMHHNMSKIKENKVIKIYKKEKPKQSIDKAFMFASDKSVKMGLLLSFIIFGGLFQMIIHQNLSQIAPLKRTFYFDRMLLNLHICYTMLHTLMLFSVFYIMTLLLDSHVSVQFYFNSFLIIFVFEVVMSLLLFHVKIISHRLFMSVSFTVLMISMIIYFQL